MSGLIGKKIGMTSLYDEKGNNLACTIIEAGPCVVTQIKNEEKDGYNSVQLGFLDKKERNINKAEAGHFKNANTAPKSNLFEFKNFENELSVGDVLNVDHFSEGEYVDISGTSKGKGFQGVVKRPTTFSDVSNLKKNFNYKPKTTVQDGVENFVKWYKKYFKVK